MGNHIAGMELTKQQAKLINRADRRWKTALESLLKRLVFWVRSMSTDDDFKEYDFRPVMGEQWVEIRGVPVTVILRFDHENDKALMFGYLGPRWPIIIDVMVMATFDETPVPEVEAFNLNDARRAGYRLRPMVRELVDQWAKDVSENRFTVDGEAPVPVPE